ncbi:PaaI family thioesterase [Roseococcus sp. YIM B11640]|uniref:PaaI family thioesterase n=1 Tax=Roseococcus sp. YIM B11640 TaxID=3133973 RepID=UPI003C7AFBB8
MQLPDHILAQTHSPFHEHLGIEILEWREGFARLACLPVRHHANRSGIVHGGVMLALLDQVNAFAGLFCDVPGRTRRAVTLDLDTRFTGQGKLGVRLLAEGHLVTAGRAIFFARGEVKDEEGRLIAFGSSTHRYREGSHTAEGVPFEAPAA